MSECTICFSVYNEIRNKEFGCRHIRAIFLLLPFGEVGRGFTTRNIPRRC